MQKEKSLTKLKISSSGEEFRSASKGAFITPYAFEQQILNQLENLREFLKNGNPEAGIPPLEPIRVDDFDYNFALNDS